MTVAVVTFGLPGAGKTTYLRNHFPKWIKVSADEIKKTLPGYDPANPSLVHQESVRLAREEVLKLAQERTPFCFDSGSINTKYSRNIFAELKTLKYKIELHVLEVPLDTCLARNAGREFSVPNSDIVAKDREKAEAFYGLVPYCSVITYISQEMINVTIVTNRE